MAETAELVVEEIEVAGPGHARLGGIHEVVVAAEREALPDDPPIPIGELADDLSRQFPGRRKRRWVGLEGSRVAGFAEMGLDLFDNLHAGWAELVVHPELRRRGAGRAMVATLVDAMDEEGRKVLGVRVRRAPAATAFLSRLGFAERSVERQNRLVVADLDVAMLHAWVARAGERASAYELRAWDDLTPPALLEAFTEAQDIMNTAPRDDLDMDDFTMTPDRLHATERMLVGTGTRWWTLAAVEAATGRIAGFTQLYFSRWRDDVAFQGDTGVHPAHRNRGLGRWIKAAQLLRLLHERPSVRRVDTSNAASNDAMLAINDALGFRPVVLWSDWQAPVDEVRARL